MLYKEIIAFCCQIHTKHINTLCGQNAYLLEVKPGGTYSDCWTSKNLELSHTLLAVARQFRMSLNVGPILRAVR
jgi:hypothetical protein